jgi:hypothetical protein
MEITSSPEGVNLNDATITQVDLLDGAVLLGFSNGATVRIAA